MLDPVVCPQHSKCAERQQAPQVCLQIICGLFWNQRQTRRFFSRAAQDLATQVPLDVLTLLRMGRLTALEKPGGGVRGIVCGDILRRLFARTIAQSITPVVEAETSPFQYALTTKSGGECVAHDIQSLTDQWDQRVRSHIRSGDVGWFVHRRGRKFPVAVRASILLRTFAVSVVRRLRRHSRCPPGRRR